MAKLEEAKPEAAAWLRATDVAKWTEAYFVGRRYGHDTSNIVESVNKALIEDRELPILQLLDALWHRVMDERATRLTTATKAILEGFAYTPFCAGLVTKSRQWARTNQVQVSSPTQARVIGASGLIYLVDLGLGTCSCGRYQVNSVPCGHAMSFIFRQRLTLEPFLPRILSTAVWQEAFTTPLPPIDISILRPSTDEPCWAPVTRIPRGRPKKERIRAGNGRGPQGLHQENIGIEENSVVQHRSHNACGTCGERDGHNAGSCRRPHI